MDTPLRNTQKHYMLAVCVTEKKTWLRLMGVQWDVTAPAMEVHVTNAHGSHYIPGLYSHISM